MINRVEMPKQIYLKKSDRFNYYPCYNIKALFISASQLAFPAEKLRSQKQKQTANFSTDFWNVEKQASEKMN
jgi:hypothetical protein